MAAKPNNKPAPTSTNINLEDEVTDDDDDEWLPIQRRRSPPKLSSQRQPKPQLRREATPRSVVWGLLKGTTQTQLEALLNRRKGPKLPQVVSVHLTQEFTRKDSYHHVVTHDSEAEATKWRAAVEARKVVGVSVVKWLPLEERLLTKPHKTAFVPPTNEQKGRPNKSKEPKEAKPNHGQTTEKNDTESILSKAIANLQDVIAMAIRENLRGAASNGRPPQGKNQKHDEWCAGGGEHQRCCHCSR